MTRRSLPNRRLPPRLCNRMRTPCSSWTEARVRQQRGPSQATRRGAQPGPQGGERSRRGDGLPSLLVFIVMGHSVPGPWRKVTLVTGTPRLVPERPSLCSSEERAAPLLVLGLDTCASLPSSAGESPGSRRPWGRRGVAAASKEVLPARGEFVFQITKEGSREPACEAAAPC